MADIEVPSTSGLIVNVVLNVFSAFTAIVFNSITMQAIKKTSSLPNPLKILLLSLALSDLAVGLVAQPLWIVNILRKKDTEVLWIIQSALANASFVRLESLPNFLDCYQLQTLLCSKSPYKADSSFTVKSNSTE